jgi:UDP-GlcNAc:undecaprenyl-phosphate GlcNAc-1-phosphate transferase
MQFVFPVAATLILLWGGIKISFVTSPVGGVWQVTTWLGSVLTFLWILGMMYTTKFLDGLDGLVCGVTVIASVVIFIVSLFWDDRSSATGLVALLVAGMALGFLRFNFFPAKIFLGEGGSVFLGYLLGVLSIISGSKIATAMLVMALPIIDTFWVIVRRVIQGRSPVLADRKHFHFRLLDQGWGHVQAVIFIYVLTLIFGVTGLVLSTRGKIIALVMVVALTTFLIRSFYTPARRRFSRPSH